MGFTLKGEGGREEQACRDARNMKGQVGQSLVDPSSLQIWPRSDAGKALLHANACQGLTLPLECMLPVSPPRLAILTKAQNEAHSPSPGCLTA